MDINIKLPMIPLRGLTVLPNMIISFSVGRAKSLEALEKAANGDDMIFVAGQKDSNVSNPGIDDLYTMGTVVKIKQVLKLPGNMTHVIVEGVKRGKLLTIISKKDCDYGEVATIEQDIESVVSDKMQALMRIAAEYFEEYSKINQHSSGNETMVNVISASKPGQLSDIIAAGMNLKPSQKQEILEITNPNERLNTVIRVLSHEMEILKLKKEIEEKVKEKIDTSQKEYYLKEQMKVIQEELGDKDGITTEINQFKKLLQKKNPPEYIKEALQKEINRLSRISVSSPESNITRNYIEIILNLPWKEKTKEKFDIKKAETILEEEHYGLKKVKERIIEYLAVRKNSPFLNNASILCLVGPPGVGKTSIAKSIAKALNKNYVRMSLGGIKDEAEIRGHRKTYVGAMPGRIINAMKQAKVINPLILLDEVDKLGNSYNGDPASALLEVLDGEQNNEFRDHYIELPYDLSQVLFVCTANSLDTMPQPLKDRMEMIMLSSYTAEEKRNIAIKHLYMKQLKKHGLKKSQLKISEQAIDDMIDYYTKEAGVRQLERTIGEICRKTVKLILSGEKKSISVTEENLEQFLGIKKYKYDKINEESQIGIVRGLAWTQFGGDTLSIEVNVMKGTGEFVLTGNMGDVMKESAKAAISYIRSQSKRFCIDENFYKEKDIHIHIPEGAVPKDGPSAGITMATAMISALTNKKVKNNIAMTGEITIRGRVLPIGGLKEKVIAAKKAGIVKIIVPYENEKDVLEISEDVRDGITFVLVKQMEEVLNHAIVEGESIWK